MDRARGQRGFTMIELMVTIMILGALAALALPMYMGVMENSKAEDAVRLVISLSNANRIYQLDHEGAAASGQLTSSCATTATCSGDGSACNLVSCKYIENIDFDNQPYVATVGNACGAGVAACVSRRTSGNNSTGRSPYSSWSYAADWLGVVTPSCMGSGCPPAPSQ